MTPEKGTTDEDIGRSEAWTEGRYQSTSQPLDQSVQAPSGPQDDPDKPTSTPVTRKDYVFPGEQIDERPESAPPGGDAG